MTYNEAVGLAIYTNRTIRGMSQPQLAQAIGLSASGLSRIENGITKPTVDHLRIVATMLSVTSAVILEDAERYLERSKREQSKVTQGSNRQGHRSRKTRTAR